METLITYLVYPAFVIVVLVTTCGAVVNDISRARDELRCTLAAGLPVAFLLFSIVIIPDESHQRLAEILSASQDKLARLFPDALTGIVAGEAIIQLVVGFILGVSTTPSKQSDERDDDQRIWNILFLSSLVSLLVYAVVKHSFGSIELGFWGMIFGCGIEYVSNPRRTNSSSF